MTRPPESTGKPQKTNTMRYPTQKSPENPRTPASQSSSWTFVLLAASALLCILFFTQSATGAGKVDISSEKLTVGFTSTSFPNADQREVQAAMHLWTRELARQMGIKAQPGTIIFSRTEDLVEAVNKGELSVVSLPALDYLYFRKIAHMSPSLVSAAVNGYEGSLLLVVRSDSGIRTIRDLRGKTLLLAARKARSSSRLWLSVLLLREGIRDPARFFRATEEAVSPSKALINIYFGKNDALILSREAFEASIVLNPQLGKKMTVLAHSGNILGVLTCIPDTVNKDLRHLIEIKAQHLHETGIGRQMFTLFQMERVVPFHPSYLEGLEDLLRERNRLAAGLNRRK